MSPTGAGYYVPGYFTRIAHIKGNEIMGRLFENPALLIVIALLIIAVVVIIAVSASSTTKRLDLRIMQGQQGFSGQPASAPVSQDVPPDAVQVLLEQQRFAHNDLLLRTGRGHRSTAWILAVIGLFVFGIVLGPIAMILANKAESYGVPAPGGKILGLIDTIFGLIIIVIYLSN